MILNTKLEKYMTISANQFTVFFAILLLILCPLHLIKAEPVPPNTLQNAGERDNRDSKNAPTTPFDSPSENQPYANRIFDADIRTMLLYTTVSELDPPIIQ